MNTNRTFRIIIVLTSLIFIQKSKAQVLGQDKDGFSSINLPTANLNVDATNKLGTISFAKLLAIGGKEEENGNKENNMVDELLSEDECFSKYSDPRRLDSCINISWRRLESEYRKINKSIFVGIDLKGQSENGLAIIFDNELISNSAGVNGSFGIHHKKMKYNDRKRAKYLTNKNQIFKNEMKINKSLENLEFYIEKLLREDRITRNYRNKLLNFKNSESQDRIDELNERISHLKSKEPLVIKDRQTEINLQEKTVAEILADVDNVLKLNQIPKFGDLDDEKKLTEILVANELLNKETRYTPKQIIEYAKNLEEKVFPKINELIVNDIPRFKYELKKLGWKNINSYEDSELNKFRLKLSSFVFFSLKEFEIEAADMKAIANLKFESLNKAKNDILQKLEEYNKSNPNSKKLNDIDFKLDLEDYLNKSTWEKVKKELIKISGQIKDKKLALQKLISDNGKDYKNELIDLFTNYLNDYKAKLNLELESQNINDKLLHFNNSLWYLKAGFSGNSFLYDFANGATSINERLIKRSFSGNRFELGWTHQFNTLYFLGINFSKDYRDNSSSLTKTTYKSTTIDNSVSPAIEFTSELLALSGEYYRFDQYQISADYSQLIRFRKNKKEKYKLDYNNDIFLSVNPYVRHRFYDNTRIIKPNTSFGIGFHAFNVSKNSVAGGFFVQANDVFDVNSELNFDEKINIGLVLKYNINSFNPNGDKTTSKK